MLGIGLQQFFGDIRLISHEEAGVADAGHRHEQCSAGHTATKLEECLPDPILHKILLLFQIFIITTTTMEIAAAALPMKYERINGACAK